EEVRSVATALAGSDLEAEQNELFSWLKSRAFLESLDSGSDYEGPPRKLRLWAVLQRLKENGSPGARRILLELTQDAAFTQNRSRAEILIAASDRLRPAPTELVKFWDDHWQTADGYSNLTVEAVIENGSPAALHLLETKMSDPRFDDSEKTAWMYS